MEKKPTSFMKDLWQFLFLLVFIVIPFRMFVAQPFVVSGDSMVPTFESGEYLIVDQLSYRLHEPRRGDVAVFHYPNDPSKFFIKRIIGLPGETVHVDDTIVSVSIPGEPKPLILEEPYVDDLEYGSVTKTLGEDEFFVMGDNRNVSFDSRSWGPLEKEHIVGRAFLRLFPLTHASYLPGAYTQTQDYKDIE
jgi:signal peptidase I